MKKLIPCNRSDTRTVMCIQPIKLLLNGAGCVLYSFFHAACAVNAQTCLNCSNIFALLLFLTLSLTACNSAAPLSVSESKDSSVREPMESRDIGNSAVSVQYAVGDIILADGSVVKTADFTSIDSANPPIAVVADLKNDNTALGVGVHRSETPLPWAADETAGSTIKFTEIVCIQENADDKTYAFAGDTDGTDNWNMICLKDPQGTANAAENYPAFDFVNTYAKACNLNGDYALGWYMPSISELYTVYENRNAINASLQKIYKLDSNAAMDGLETNWYWSSSQSDANNDYAWFIHYFNGYASDCPKNFTNVHVLAVRTF